MGSALQIFTPLGKGHLFAPEDCVFNSFSPRTSPGKIFSLRKNTSKTNMNDGFVVKGEDTIEFLEEKLEILGLNEKEAEEFIIYWLPQMEKNKYNYIRFETQEEINKNMPLEITPVPDTVIRINMEWKALEEAIKVKEQVLEEAPKRNGFTVVEWGGTILN